MTDPTNYHNAGDDWPTAWDGRSPVAAAELFDAIADLVALRAQPWRQHAACRGVGPELFFAEHRDMLTAQTARAVCNACPVADDCAAYAINSGERSGIWGGVSVDNLRRNRQSDNPTRTARREPQPINHGTYAGYRMHMRRDIPVCDACRDARNTARRAAHAEGRAA